MLGDADWASLEEGKKYKVVIQLDDLIILDAEATGFRLKALIWRFYIPGYKLGTYF